MRAMFAPEVAIAPVTAASAPAVRRGAIAVTMERGPAWRAGSDAGAGSTSSRIRSSAASGPSTSTGGEPAGASTSRSRVRLPRTTSWSISYRTMPARSSSARTAAVMPGRSVPLKRTRCWRVAGASTSVMPPGFRPADTGRGHRHGPLDGA
jgi:hypothetical protein